MNSTSQESLLYMKRKLKHTTQSSVFMSTVDFLGPYQQMCRQLDALLTSSCLFTQPEIKCRLRTPTAGLPADRGHNWPCWDRDITHSSSVHLQQAPRSALIQASTYTPMWLIPTKRREELLPPGTITVCCIRPWCPSSPVMSHSQEEVMAAPRGHAQQGHGSQLVHCKALALFSLRATLP